MWLCPPFEKTLLAGRGQKHPAKVSFAAMGKRRAGASVCISQSHLWEGKT